MVKGKRDERGQAHFVDFRFLTLAWRLKQKLLVVMAEREAERRLERRVDIDDVYFSGENPGGKAGRNSENKVQFLAS